MAIQWTDDLAVGIEEIDRQHQELYVMVAALHDAMRMNQLDRVLGVVSFLERYALEHFATEERHMAAQAYPRLPEHRALHESFVSDLQQHKAAIRRERGSAIARGGALRLGGFVARPPPPKGRRRDGPVPPLS